MRKEQNEIVFFNLKTTSIFLNGIYKTLLALVLIALFLKAINMQFELDINIEYILWGMLISVAIFYKFALNKLNKETNELESIIREEKNVAL